MDRTALIIYLSSLVAGIALFVVLFFVAGDGLWVLWLVLGAVATALLTLGANIVVGYRSGTTRK